MELALFLYGYIKAAVYGGYTINANFSAGSGGINAASIGNISSAIFLTLLVITAAYAVLVSLRETEGSGFAVVMSAFLRGGLIMLIGAAVLAYVA